MISRIYTGHVAHARTRPITNAFRYRVAFLLADLDELDAWDAASRVFGHGRRLAQVRDADHGPRDGSALRPWIEGVLDRIGIDVRGGHILLLTFPRTLGFAFRPASFYYCYTADGVLRAVLAEVSNTFGEHHDYVLHAHGEPLTADARPGAVKAFRVSPFIEMDARYRFTFTDPGLTFRDGDPLEIVIEDDVAGAPLLTARVALEAREATDEALRRMLTTLGPMSLRAGTLIGYQALRLLSRGLPWLSLPPATGARTTYE